MINVLIVTRPKYDDGTEYLSYYASLVIKEARDKNISVSDFEGEEANKGDVTKFIEKRNPNIVFVNGHGNEDSLYGHKEIIFSMDNINLLKGRLIYARACSAGAKLGKGVVKGNNGCFIGYKYPFSFWFDEKWSAKPSNDNIAKLYLEPSNQVMLSLIKGKNSQEAHEKSKALMLENMKRILVLEEKKEPGTMGMLQILWNNFDGQVIYGNFFARLE